MDWVKLVYSVILLICGISILVSIFSQKGDERRKFINQKAQSYVFIVVFGMLILFVAQSIYLTYMGESSYIISPIMFLTIISIIYLGTLLIYRNKYGD
ncbi:hypothetical protein CEY16_13165 [Halalkalibacillus sediminis]|uniref:DUF2178 domain-containing protein n=1 Tax=Halalkalibacillus sediminis TaxID=2018042 RepID=A0A2I0QR08_9BACI|nr:hypothetical protein [Halalkalibacillus sediminis]PKR76764.1 hypothetical protein CEY16_13165 [Halalkalibacillus sediminis]